MLPVFGSAAPGHRRHTRDHFRNVMPDTIRADHPSIQGVVSSIRAVSGNPLEQIVIVNDVTHLLVDYDEDARVFGMEEFHATLDEMLARRRESGWIYLRDDCDGRAVFAAHLLAALGIPWRLEASFWKGHAWVVATVNGTDYDLLDLRKGAPETTRLSYRLLGRHFVRTSHPPPVFRWRRAWAERTAANFHIGMELGLLRPDSRPDFMRERYATDWTSRSPGGHFSPVENRWDSVAVAGFPFGEPIQASAAIAASRPASRTPETMTAHALAVPTSSGHSADQDPER
jgi:hypothetical protein